MKGLNDKIQNPDLKENRSGLISANQLATELDISRVSLWRLEKSGKLNVYRLGKKCFYKISEVIESLK